MSRPLKHGLSLAGNVDPRYSMWHNAKAMARKKSLSFNLHPLDIPEIPCECPVLQILLKHSTGTGYHAPNSPTLDRIVTELGYTKGNVRIISHRANTLRNNATSDELAKIMNDVTQIEEAEASAFCLS